MNNPNFMQLKQQVALNQWLSHERAFILYGPRRVGKTTFLKNYLTTCEFRYKMAIGDSIRVQAILGSRDIAAISDFVEGYDLIAIDEAQFIPQVVYGLKILVDQIPDIYVIATGSSSFDLKQQTGEPLTGRKRTLVLYPFSQSALRQHYNKYELKENLEHFLIYGTYPEVLTTSKNREKQFVLTELTESYLLKDVLTLESIKASQQLWDLLKHLAFRIGSEVSHHELSKKVGLDVKTIARYLDLLEKGFVIKRVRGFSRNLANEITKKAKYYFLDTGIRNAVINNFNNFKDRDDQGPLFENFIVMERVKYHTRNSRFANLYFWRTHQQQEIDLVEESSEQLNAFEVKWSTAKKSKPPKAWRNAYPNATYEVINRENYPDYLLESG